MGIEGKYINIYKKVDKYMLPNDNYMKGKVFHYTNIDALENMIKSQTLWLTKSDYLNDKEELKHSFNLLYEVYNKGKYRYLKRNTIDYFIELIKEKLKYTYIISFSINPDSMFLWSTYSSFDGYNIELCLEDISQREWDERVYFLSNKVDLDGNYEKIYQTRKNDDKCFASSVGKVIYNQKEKESILRDLLNSLNSIEKILAQEEYADESERHSFINLISYIYSTLTFYIPLFKNSYFENEEEYRVSINILKLDKLDIIRFRKKDGVFIPYIIIGFDDEDENHKGLPIKSITIGPKNNSDLAEKGLVEFLLSNGYNKDIENREEEQKKFVIKSSINIR